MKRRLFSKILGLYSSGSFYHALPGFNINNIMDSKYIHQIKVGHLKCTILYDMDFVYKGKDFFMDTDEITIEKELMHYSQTLDQIPSPYIGLLVEDDKNRVLIDTGVGYMETAQVINGQQFQLEGRMQRLLREIGVGTDEITHLVLTHFHPDHIGGVYSDLGDLIYANASIYAHQDEWHYWMGSQSAQQPPIFKYFIDHNIVPLKGENIHLVSTGEEEILEGIRLIKTPGHTPGHLSVSIQSQGQSILYISDTWLHPLHIKHLDWKTIYDLDHQNALKSRKQMLEKAYQNNMLVQSFHFPFPGLGFVDKVKDAWKWVPK